MGTFFLIAIGVICIALGTPSLIGYLRVKKAAPTSVADINPELDEVELEGVAESVEELFTTPITREPAMAYHLKVQYIDPNRDASSVATVENSRKKQSFIMNDGTGKVWVDSEAAAMNYKYQTWEVDKGETPPTIIRQFIEEGNSTSSAATEAVYPYERRFIEGRLSPGGDAYVFGPVQPGPGKEAPKGTIKPYVGVQDMMKRGQENADNGFLYGLAGETDVFTISNTGEEGAEDTIKGQSMLFIGAGVAFIAIALLLAFW